MPFEKGNKHGGAAAKQRLFDGALRRAIAQDDGARLRAAAENLLTCASKGEPWALQMLADRLDGKASQSVDVQVSARPEDMSLAELTAQLAAAAGRGAEAPQSPDQPGELH